jgi:CheY-like chemotaxis protein
VRTTVAHLPPVRPATAASPRPTFIVDDDPVSHLLITQALVYAGLTNPTLTFLDGADAMSELLARAASGPSHLPALVFLDWQMPGLDGIDVLSRMHRTADLQDVPVIMLSANDGAQQVTQAYELGARSYLVKPLAFSALGGVVRNLALPWQLA